MKQCSKDDYLSLTAKGCEVCGRQIDLCVDHDYKTGKVRGCLCTRCNLTLGMVKDDSLILKKLSNYLEKHNELQTIEPNPNRR